ncbi:hypothetical protein [Actinomyces qiguomingii]|uniref:hypothetical protein n=1 Tax=Actinomyces qiguomingii TaxID=2057800 RepID=UPI000FFF1A24|nr:hypothetical protein [Actinomyces qiguomingii]
MPDVLYFDTVERSDHLYAHHEWRSVPEGVELTSIKSWHSRACMNLPNSIMIVGSLITLAIPWFVPYRIPGSIGSSMTAISLLAILVFGILADEPRKPRTRPAILLQPEGILAWPNEPYRCRIPWTTSPEATGIRHYGLNIVTRKRLEFAIPLKHLNISGRQLARVIEFYTKHINLRHELAKPEGLERVRSLMQHPVWEIEEQLPPPKPKRPRRHRK